MQFADVNHKGEKLTRCETNQQNSLTYKWNIAERIYSYTEIYVEITKISHKNHKSLHHLLIQVYS